MFMVEEDAFSLALMVTTQMVPSLAQHIYIKKRHQGVAYLLKIK